MRGTDVYDVRITGSAGSPVLLLPGGAASSRGFFPGLVEALARHRVMELDRPGTGVAQRTGTATLTSGASAAAQAIRDLDAGPAVVVGQSLGGLVAQQLAVDAPDVVAGLVLIDPTPADQLLQLRLLPWVVGVLGAPGQLPVVGSKLEPLMWRLFGAGKAPVAPEARSGLTVILESATLAATGRATRSLPSEAPALLVRQGRLEVPAVVLTADRKQGHAIRASHEALAVRLGARLVAPAGAVHGEHLRDPAGVRDLVLSVIRETEALTA